MWPAPPFSLGEEVLVQVMNAALCGQHELGLAPVQQEARQLAMTCHPAQVVPDDAFDPGLRFTVPVEDGQETPLVVLETLHVQSARQALLSTKVVIYGPHAGARPAADLLDGRSAESVFVEAAERRRQDSSSSLGRPAPCHPGRGRHHWNGILIPDSQRGLK